MRRALAVSLVALCAAVAPLTAGTARAATAPTASPPGPPIVLGWSGNSGGPIHPCVTGPSREFSFSARPVMEARAVDPATVTVTFQWSLLGGPVIGEATSAPAHVPVTYEAEIPQGDLVNGQSYSFRVRADGVDGPGPFSAPCEFSVDTARPDRPPIVTSLDISPNSFNNDVLGRSLRFTFDPNGVADVVAFDYEVFGSVPTVVPTVQGQPVTVRITPHVVPFLEVKVFSLDRAGNSSPEAEFSTFIRPPAGPVGFWQFDEGSGQTVADATGHGHTATLTGSASWTRGRTGSGLRVHGAHAAATTTGPLAHTDRNFAVAAWVRLKDRTHSGVAVSQDGVRRSGFTLGYSATADRWTFATPRSDTDGATVDRVLSADQPEVGVWTLLVGAFDLSTGQITLYVNGEAAGSTAHPVVTDAPGPVRIGQGQVAGAGADTWRGVLDDVHVYDRTLVEDCCTHDVSNLVNHPAELTGSWSFDGKGDDEPDLSGNQRDGHLDGGVSRVPGISGTAISLDGVTGSMTTSGPAVRTDRSFAVSAWVRLDRLDRSATVVSQDGTVVSGFRLEYRADLQSWNFRVPVADATLPPGDDATAILFAPVESGVWTHLIAVYDKSVDMLSLSVLVDGELIGDSEAPHISPWRAGGALVVGRGLDAGQPTDFLAGDVDEVNVFQGTLTPDEFDQLAAQASPPAPTD
ncbi:MAG TPA: LamG domain-containing protein [Mycobacteriales bacterium]|nr:LamG domain-containing protein [Mycobacteriales bacterium]